MSRDKQISEMAERNCKMFSSKEEYEHYRIKLIKREVAEEIFAEIDKILDSYSIILDGEIGFFSLIAGLKKKYTESENNK